MAVLERATKAEALAPDSRYYRPRGRFLQAWTSRDREVITDGPAGTGKSRMWLERGYQIAMKYPGSRGLILRKTRASLTDSALVTFEQKVLPPGLPWVTNQQREQRHSYNLPNGSEIVVGGLDKPEKLFSTEYDWIYVQEATECSEDDWESLLRALRNNVVPYQQIVGDCNPGAPSHWIKRRAATGALKLIQSRHEDNPEYWDEQRSEWTERGKQYLSVLDGLTGVRLKRLRHGLWVAAENVIYDDWDPAIHLMDRFTIPAEWTRYRTVDFGFVNNFVCQWWAEDHEGRLYLYREYVSCQQEVKDHAHRIYELSKNERISATITDHDVEGRADLSSHMTHSAAECGRDFMGGDMRYGMDTTTPANKSVWEGIEAVSNRLKRGPDGEPRLYVLRDALVDRNPVLDESKRPIG